MRGWQRCLKRVADFVCALFGLVLLSPVFLAIALIIKFQKNGPVIFRQERIGYKGKPFTIYKFRTLSTVVEDEGPQLIAQSDTVKSTHFERYLREHHLDELPQLWNVLCGDMSLVGPRPERKYFIDQIMEHTHDYILVYQMRPGLTSEATLYNGYTDTIEKMLKRLDMDIRYLENRTLMLDLKIILSTVYGMLKSLPLAGTNGKAGKKTNSIS
ncbi:MAG: sugar transferase [Prevotella sp.]|nr:sugar transferase [Prevotella sp.]